MLWDDTSRSTHNLVNPESVVYKISLNPKAHTHEWHVSQGFDIRRMGRFALSEARESRMLIILHREKSMSFGHLM